MAAAAVGLAIIGGAFVVPQTANAAPTGSSTATSESVRRLNTRAQELFEAKDIAGAADTYAEIFQELPENHVNREERDNNILVTLETYREAYEVRRSLPGDASKTEAIELLRKALRVFESYENEYKRVYGGTSISAEAAASGQMIRDLLAAAEREAPPAPKVEEAPKPPVIEFTDTGLDPGPNGTGLIVTGSVFLAAGLGTTAMIIVGAQMTKKATREKDRAETPEQADDADRRGSTGNALIITGAVLTAAFVISGATMLGVGIHRRNRYMAFTPAVGRGYAGLSLSGRF